MAAQPTLNAKHPSAREKRVISENLPKLSALLHELLNPLKAKEWLLIFLRAGIIDRDFPLSKDELVQTLSILGLEILPMKLQRLLSLQTQYFGTDSVPHRGHIQYASDEAPPYVVVEDANFPARGSFGEVYQVQLRWNPSKRLARKRIFFMGPDTKVRLQQEIDILKKFQHPHAIPYLGSYSYRNDLYLLFECAHINLSEFFLNPRPWFLELARKEQANVIMNWIVDIWGALSAFHDMNGIHRDIKPQNILLKDRTIYLADFGLAKLRENVSENTASVSGTERYKAPEMGWSSKFTRKADVFSLACVTLELITFGCDKNIKGFDEFRALHGAQNCHRADPIHSCFRHNLTATRRFIHDHLRPVAQNLHFILDMLEFEALVEQACLRASSRELWKTVTRYCTTQTFFKKDKCCEMPRRQEYTDNSVKSIMRQMNEVSISGEVVGEQGAWLAREIELMGGLGRSCF
jgi:serine/threonine protein kinase